MPIKEDLEKLKSFILDSITDELTSEELENRQQLSLVCDELVNEYNGLNEEILDLKGTIIKVVKNSGSATPPSELESEANTPKSLEDIAKEILGG